MMASDVRWKQRLASFSQALDQLNEGVAVARTRPLSNLEKQGLIQAFEFTHELAWNVLKDYIQYQGYTQISGSRDAVREAFSRGLIDNGDVWMDMIASRNMTTHTYNRATADSICYNILNVFVSEFARLQTTMQQKA